jgi:hypothetical protein
VVVGRAWILFGSRKNSKPEKYLKMRQNPHHPLHALLGADELEDSLADKRHCRHPDKILTHNLTFGNYQKLA